MKPGDYVKFGYPHGSTGQIESANHYGGFYVKWVYGRDSFGEIVSAIGSYKENELMLISYEEYVAVRDRKFNSG